MSREKDQSDNQESQDLVEKFNAIMKLADGKEFLDQAKAWKAQYQAIKSTLPAEQSPEMARREIRLEVRERVIAKKSIMLEEMENYSKQFKEKFDTYSSHSGTQQSEDTTAPSLKTIHKDYKKFIEGDFFKGLKKSYPDVAQKFETWVGNRLEKERGAVLRKDMLAHVENFKKQFEYLRSDNDEHVVKSMPTSLNDLREGYNKFKAGDFYNKFKAQYPSKAAQFERLIDQEINKEAESLQGIRAQIGSELDSISKFVTTSKHKPSKELLGNLKAYQYAIVENKDLEVLDSRSYYTMVLNGLDKLKKELNLPTISAKPTPPTKWTKGHEPTPKAESTPTVKIPKMILGHQRVELKKSEPKKEEGTRTSEKRNSTR